jgi:glycosyltransferase involved in cell wall biosynthesis
MKIAFDASDLCTGRADGTTRYTAELAKRLPEIGKDVHWDLYGPCIAPTPHPTPLPVRGEGNTVWHSSPFPAGWTQARFPFELMRDKPDVLFMPIQQLPIFRPHRTKTVAVIHDLAFHEFKEQFRYKDWLLLHTFSAQVANEADAIIAVSEATKQDIEKYYGRTHSVHVVHHGIDHGRFKVFSEEEKNAGLKKLQEKYPEIKKPYILFVGQIQPRKNIVRLVEAFEALHKKGSVLQLVIAGGHGWNNAEIYKRIAESPERKNIILPGAVPDELLPTIYANAEVFVLPSLQEGFGIPLIEAAACGTPIVTSDRSSMKEIAEDFGVLIDPEDSHSLTNGIHEAFNKREKYSKKSINMAKKYSWDVTAQQTLRILKEVTHI